MKVSKTKLVQEVFRNKSFIFKIPVIFRMLKAAIKGDYKMNKKSIFFVVLISIYMLSPLDLIPDWIPFIGILDDLGLLMMVISKLSKEADDFLIWEKWGK